MDVKAEELPHLHTSILPFLMMVLLSLSACISTAEEPPAVPDSTLVDVLVGLHLAEARAELRSEVPEGLRDSILARHQLDVERFETLMDYYVAHPDSYAVLYRKVLNHLSNERVGMHMPDRP